MSATLAVVLFIVSGIVLAKSSSFSVRGLVTIARYFKIPDFAVSFILMSLATSLPELVVGAMAAAEGESVFALSAVIGSNIADLTLVAGILAIVAGGMGVKKILEQREAYYTVAVCLVLLLFLIDGTVTRVEGGALLGVYALYMVHLLGQIRHNPKATNSVDKKHAAKQLLALAVGIGGLLLGAKGMVMSAEVIAVRLNLPFVLLGLLLVSLSTSIPELAFELRAWKEKHHDLALGDLLGSVVTNTALITGVVALIHPINAGGSITNIDTALVFLVFSAFIFLFFLRSKSTLSRLEGVIMVGIYLLFVCLMYAQTMLR